jgi:uncharacterized membrane protein HdeD (DUF308 family)
VEGVLLLVGGAAQVWGARVEREGWRMFASMALAIILVGSSAGYLWAGNAMVLLTYGPGALAELYLVARVCARLHHERYLTRRIRQLLGEHHD